jgi:hypothetical protein
LFGREYGIPFIGQEKVVVNQREKKEQIKYKKPFMNNRLHEPSTFSPAIMSFLPNLKSAFPSVFHA